MGIRALRVASLALAAILLNGCFDDADEIPKPGTGSPTGGIDASGGKVNGPSGAQIIVPAGALSRRTQLVITETATGAPSLPSGLTELGPMFAFTPHGTTFATAVTVRVPFDPSRLTSGMAPRLYKTNAQAAWEVVAGATVNGSAMVGEVTSFSYFIVASDPPPVPVVGVHRLWYFERLGRDGFEEVGEIGHDDEGEAFEQRVLGPLRLPQGDGTTSALGEIYSSPTGSTYWAGIRAPAESSREDEGGIGGRTELEQIQWFRKQAADARLRLKITYVSSHAIDGDPRPSDEPWMQHLWTDVTISAMEADADESFFERNGKLLLLGRQGFWDHFIFGDTPRPLWRASSFTFEDDADGTQSHMSARLSLNIDTPIYVEIPLEDIAVGETFIVRSNVLVEAIDRRQTESYAAAFFKDPQGTSGNEFEHEGLELLPPQSHGWPATTIEPAAPCSGETRPEAGELSFQWPALELIEQPIHGATVLVSRTGGSSGEISALVTTSDGTAIAGTDYTSVSIPVVFADGEDGLRSVTIPIAVDDVAEPDKTVRLTLSDPRGCAELGDTTTATLTIVDDDRPIELPETYSVSGTVTGLSGTGLVIEEVRTGARVTPANGTFAFAYAYPNLSTYDVRVVTQPTNPMQSCTVANGVGTIQSANVTNVEVTCTTPAPTGSLDGSFGEGGKVTANLTGGARSVALQSDGKILAVGRLRLLRFNPNGTPDTGFGTNGSVNILFNGGSADEALAVAVDAQQRILVAGYTRVGAQDDFAVARFNTDGTVDTSFGAQGRTSIPVFDDGVTNSGATITGHTDRAYRVLTQPDGKILVAGHGAFIVNDHGLVTTQNNYVVVRLNADGSLDPTFSGDGRASSSLNGGEAALAYAAVLQEDGKILLGGRYGSSTGDSNAGLVRFNADGSIEATFGREDFGYTDADIFGSWDEIADLALAADGSILAAAQVNSPNHDFHFVFSLLRFSSDGAYDRPFVTPIGTDDDHSRAIALQGDGKILVAGQASSVTVSDFAVVRHNADGSLDTTFGNNGVVTVDFFNAVDGATDMLVQPDGRILVIGMTRSGSSNILGIARIMP